MYSMTGYGTAEKTENNVRIKVEIRTVNNRNFDFNCKMPRAFIMFEDAIRKTVASYVLRGKIDLFLTVSDKRETSSNIELDEGKAKSYYDAAKTLSEKFNLPFDLTASSLMRMPEVISDDLSTEVASLEDFLISVVKEACENLNAMRKVEGEKLVIDMLSRIETVKILRQEIMERAPLVVAEYKERLKNRIEEALKDVKMDETRLLNEVAFYTDKVNIDEELTRLNSHINQFVSIVKTEGAGKKLDFLMQEFNRETNTICSKSNDIQVTGSALSIKNEIEKIREQVQNLE